MIGHQYPQWKKTLDNAAVRMGLSAKILTHFGHLQCNMVQITPAVEVQHGALNQNNLLSEKWALEMMDKATCDGLAGSHPHSAKGTLSLWLTHDGFHIPLPLMNWCWRGNSRANLKKWGLSTCTQCHVSRKYSYAILRPALALRAA